MKQKLKKSCMICNGVMISFELGYGSAFDGNAICCECAERYIDPAIRAAVGQADLALRARGRCTCGLGDQAHHALHALTCPITNREERHGN